MTSINEGESAHWLRLFCRGRPCAAFLVKSTTAAKLPMAYRFAKDYIHAHVREGHPEQRAATVCHR